MYTLVGINGNAYSVMGYASACMKREGKTKEQVDAYVKEAKAGDYDNLLSVSDIMIDSLNSL